MSGVPSWLKPPRPHDDPVAQQTGLMEGFDAARPIALNEVLEWDLKWQRLLYRSLVPADLITQFGIDPIDLTDASGERVAHMRRGQGQGTIRFELFHAAGARDAMIELELGDTQFNQIEVIWLAIQNPYSDRFDIDIMPDGQSTLRGSLRRNIPAEEAALSAGLAPGQIRGGLGAFTDLSTRLESFMSCLQQKEYIAQPLYYHTAVLFERIGFAYSQGHAQMVRIDRGFSPGGELRGRLDGSSPFRDPALANTVRGRAWAIHAGLLDRGWDRVRMYKRLGVNANIDTCPGLPW